MKQNKGVTLVELVVVMAVLAVLLAAAFTGFGMLSNWNLNQCTDSIDAALNETMVNAMSKEACALTISVDAKGVSYLNVTGQQTQKLADTRITIFYKKSGSLEEVSISPGHPLILSYSRSSGAFLPIITAVNETTGAYEYLKNGTQNVYCSEIIIKMGSQRIREIKLEKDTGKHYIK